MGKLNTSSQMAVQALLGALEERGLSREGARLLRDAALAACGVRGGARASPRAKRGCGSENESSMTYRGNPLSGYARSVAPAAAKSAVALQQWRALAHSMIRYAA